MAKQATQCQICCDEERKFYLFSKVKCLLCECFPVYVCVSTERDNKVQTFQAMEFQVESV